MQTLELTSSSEPNVEDAFFNQVVVLSQASLILLANAKKNVIYAIHVDYGENPLSTRMDFLAEFSVKMPILSLTATSDCYVDSKHMIQVYCVQTQAIQQYALDLSLCLLPPQDNTGIERELSASRGPDDATSDSLASPVVGIITVSNEHSGSKISLEDSSAPVSGLEAEISQGDDSDALPSVENMVDQSTSMLSVDKVVESGPPDLPEAPPDDTKPDSSDITMIPNLPKFTHLVTPSEILSQAVSETETRFPEVDSSNLLTETTELDVKVIGEAGLTVNEDLDSQREPQIRGLDDRPLSLSSQVTESDIKNPGEEDRNAEKVVSIEDDVEQPTAYPVKDEMQERPNNVSQSGGLTLTLESPSVSKGKKQKIKQSQLSQSSYVPESINEQNNYGVADSGSPLANIQEMLNQVILLLIVILPNS